jgi:predicted DNA repair protein MutK
MAGGLLALLDDVAAIAKVAAASVDDVIGQATKAGTKVAGVVIDDAAVTPGYAQGFAADRELPIVWKIARGSVLNKVVILLPLALILSAFAPWALPPLLMIGGLYLCYEGAEKVGHWLNPPAHHDRPIDEEVTDAVHLEEEKVRGAIKTDFILSAEIMTIALAALDTDSIWFEAAALLIVGLAITALVYGSVALIVKADDIGLHMAAEGRTGVGRAVGRGIVRGMPGFLKALTVVGTAAMLWVGGAIMTHGLAQMGWHGPEDVVHTIAHAFAALGSVAEWLAGAALHGVLGLALGLILMPVVNRVLAPALRAVGVGGAGAHTK